MRNVQATESWSRRCAFAVALSAASGRVAGNKLGGSPNGDNPLAPSLAARLWQWWDVFSVRPVLDIRELVVQREGFACALPSLALVRGETAALVGPSGCGKSSVLRAMFGLPNGRCATARGVVECNGTRWPADADAARRLLRDNVSFFAQDAKSALDPVATIVAQLARASGRSENECDVALRGLGVEAGRRHPHAVSGGEAQRAMFALAALRGAELLVADEPTAHLDDVACARIAEALAAHCARGGATLLATHDPRLLAALPMRQFVFDGGSFREGCSGPKPWPSLSAASMSGSEAVLVAEQVAVQRDGRTLFRGVSATARAGRVLAVVGASGVGKTSFAQALVGRVLPSEGRVERRVRGLVAYVSQDARGSLTPSRTLRSLAMETKADGVDLEQLAKELALPTSTLDKTAAQLSGGEQRRGAILRALAAAPAALVLDEPTASLDRDSAERVARLVRKQCEDRGLAVVCITHDESFAASLGDERLELRGS